jgi:hypothetical protein
LAYNSSSGNDIYAKRELLNYLTTLYAINLIRSGSTGMTKLLSELGQKNFAEKLIQRIFFLTHQKKALSQRVLRKEYTQDKGLNANQISENYLDFYSYNDSFNEFKTPKKKQTERAFQEEEAKVFVIINSFGGSVGNGITVHDALQFIKAGSLTLALGVAASAASLALAVNVM